jgi:hypothetical protein
MNTAVTTQLNDINTNISIGMDEVVSVFVAKYEDGLFTKKDELTNAIKAAKAELVRIEEELIAFSETTKAQFEVNVPALDITFRVTKIEINWDNNRYNPNTIQFVVDGEEFSKSNSCGQIRLNRFRPIPESVLAQEKAINAQLKARSAELFVVLESIKSVGRKERQIRGRISELKIAESGLSSLLTNPDMLKLVHIE